MQKAMDLPRGVLRGAVSAPHTFIPGITCSQVSVVVLQCKRSSMLIDLEDRIMMLAKRIPMLSRSRAIGLALLASITFGIGAVLARAITPQTTPEPPRTTGNFAGTWHWMFEGRSFSTMILIRSGSGLSGSVTPSRIALNDDGGLLRADPSEDNTPMPITRATMDGSALHIRVKDGFEFIMTLKDDEHAEIHPEGAPPNMQPITAERIHHIRGADTGNHR